MRTLSRLPIVAGIGLAVLLMPLRGHGSAAAAHVAVPVTAPTMLPSCPDGLTAGSTVSPPGGQPFITCSGRVASFDGTPLDTDVTIPIAPVATPRPLMIFFHGWGQDKTTWESSTLTGNGGDSYHWNNAWFAAQNYVVLNYSARGFAASCGKVGSGAGAYIYSNDPACSNVTGEESWVHLADRRWEIHDAQFLAGTLVDAGLADPQRIVASGGSYGGGQSWDMALSQDEVVTSASTDPNNPTLVPWTSPVGHTSMHLVAAAPMYPWTDLADALTQNGTAADGANGGPADGASGGTHETPLGVLKQSYVAGLYADGVRTAQYVTPGSTDPTADLTSWYAALNAGEPYESNPIALAALVQVGGAFRSPFAMPVPTGTHEVPTFVIQGETDPLFPAFQVLDMINHLKAVDPKYPVWAFLGDVGHAYAFNPQDVWHQAHDASNQWLASVMAGTAPTNPAITVTSTICGATSPTAPYPDQVFTASSYGSLASSVTHLTGAAAQTSADTGPGQLPTVEGKAADPIVSGGGAVGTAGCPVIASAQSDVNQASYTWTPPTGTLIGAPIVNVDVAVTGAPTGANAALAARLWDVDPTSGNQTLLTRTVLRITAAASTSQQHLDFELWPQTYAFIAGHQLKLELTQNDQLTWRSDNETSSLTFTNLDLALPMTATIPPTNVAEAPIAPALPIVAILGALAVGHIRRRRTSIAPATVNEFAE